MLDLDTTLVIVAPHPDDAELGAAMTAHGHTGDVTIVLVTNGTDPRRILEAEQGARRLAADLVRLPLPNVETRVAVTADLIDAIAGQLDPWATVLAPPVGDTHQDHDAVARACRAAVRRSTVSLLEYETPSAPPGWAPNLYVPGSAASMEAKFEAVAAHATQSDRPYVDRQVLLARAIHHGAQIGANQAEAFRVVRAAHRP